MRLTPRGIGLLAAGAVLAVVAAATSSLALARIAALLLGLMLVALLWVAVSRTRALSLRLRRHVEPARPTVGTDAVVRLRIVDGKLPLFSRLRERTPSELNRRAVRAQSERRNAWEYAIRPMARGHHRLGPATVLITDPLGLVRLPTEGEPGGHLLVWPRITMLDESLRLRDLSGAENSPFGLPERSLEDLTLREYVRGDDIHRVHWRSSARRGELMVRADEPSQPTAIDLMLFLRRRGMQAEWAVSAYASLATSLLSDAVPVRLHHCRAQWDSDDLSVVPSLQLYPEDALDAIAPAEPLPTALRREQWEGLQQAGPCLIAVLQEPDEPMLERIVRLAGSRRAFALIVADRNTRTEATDALTRHGWQVYSARAHGDATGVRHAWTSLLATAVTAR